MEHKAFALEISSLGETGEFEGYASVFGNVDLQSDIVVPGAFKKTLRENKKGFPLLYQHNSDEPIGLLTSVGEDELGLPVKGSVNMDVQRGRESFSLMKQGVLGGLSIGYKSIQETFQGQVRLLKEVALREVSLVTFPANTLAVVTTVKAMSDEQLGELLEDGDFTMIKNAARLLELATDVPDEQRPLLEETAKSLQALLDGGAADMALEPSEITRALTMVKYEYALKGVKTNG